VNVGQGLVLQQQPLQALAQLVSGEGFGEIAVGTVFDGSHDLGTGGFGGDHDEQGAAPDDGTLVQFLQHLLAVLTFAEVVVAEDQIVAVFLRNAAKSSMISMDWFFSRSRIGYGSATVEFPKYR